MESWEDRKARGREAVFKAECAMHEAKERDRLRIEFAKAALTGILASYASARAPDAVHDEVAKDAWRMADAMLRQRYAK